MYNEVFIAYRPKNDFGYNLPAHALAKELNDALVKKGLKPFFFDVMEASINGTASKYDEQATRALKSAQVMVIILPNLQDAKDAGLAKYWKAFYNTHVTGLRPELNTFILSERLDSYYLPTELQKFENYDRMKNFNGLVARVMKYFEAPFKPNQLERSAENGYTPYQYILGRRHFFGEKAKQNYKEAVYWLAKAASNECSDAEFLLGYCYQEGLGVIKNPVESAYWYLRSAEHGHPGGQANIGCCYAEGNGVYTDYAKAFKWSKMAAEKGEPVALYNLGYMYYKGHGVKKDMVEAVNWLNKARAKGYAKATTVLKNLGYL